MAARKTMLNMVSQKKCDEKLFFTETIFSSTTYICEICNYETTHLRKCIKHFPSKNFQECLECDHSIRFFHACEGDNRREY